MEGLGWLEYGITDGLEYWIDGILEYQGNKITDGLEYVKH